MVYYFYGYAEYVDVFGWHGMFRDYLRDVPVNGMRKAFVELFRILYQEPEERDKYLADDYPELAAFPLCKRRLIQR